MTDVRAAQISDIPLAMWVTMKSMAGDLLDMAMMLAVKLHGFMKQIP
ncbi:MAG: hypothetical protein FWG14_09905 [Peptococcaceae bacterium]|nr:hypothetical protein [Peptococcaceae bacterium]